MKFVAVLSFLISSCAALPQQSCVTTTTEIIVPTTTQTLLSTYVTTIHPTTAEDLGTFTYVERISSTKTLETLTSRETACTASGTIVAGITRTVYTSSAAAAAPAAYNKRNNHVIYARQADPCTVTVSTTTTVGGTYTFVPANKTSTFYDYTAFTQATVTRTSYGGTAYAIATATQTTSAMCGPTVNATSDPATVTRDVRCQPTAIISAVSGYGLNYADDVPIGGAAYTTTASDASECCQLCTEAESCAASSWDIRTGQCRLTFPVDFESGDLNCGEGLLAFYDYGPDHPMPAGSGLYVATVCGNAAYAAASPDDGS